METNTPLPSNFVITIGRQFGSGGRELGQALAREMGIRYYDKEMLHEAARRVGMSKEFFEKSDERFPSFFNGIFSFSHGYNASNLFAGSTSISDENIYRAQSDFILAAAEAESCVFVGRSADYVLRHHPRCLNIFVHAPIDACVRRIVARGDTTPEKARAQAEKINRLRADYYNFYTDKTWGAAESYDLCIDTSLLPISDIVEMIKLYVARRFGSRVQ